jgi:hypothetical protein
MPGTSPAGPDPWAAYYDVKIATARLEIERAAGEVEGAADELERIGHLVQKGAMADVQLTTAQRWLKQCRKEKQLAESRLAELEAARTLVLSISEDKRSLCINA